jgi:predicted HTH domain antitoxin
MTIILPQDIVERAGLSEAEILTELACRLYETRRLGYGPAVRLSGLSRIEFDRELGARRIPICTLEQLEHDLVAARELAEQQAVSNKQ